MKKLLIQVGTASDVGSIREVNEDRILFRKNVCTYGEVGIFVIADGVGGLGNGDMASGLAVDMVSDFWNRYVLETDTYSTRDMTKRLANLFERINQKVFDYYAENGSRIATTLTVLYLYKDWYLVLHVGDTRLYLARNYKLNLLTEDQTWAAKKNVLINCIGNFNQKNIYLRRGKIKEDDKFLLCSDGFYNCISDNEILDILSIHDISMQKMIQGLFSSLKNSAADNLSAVLIKCNFQRQEQEHERWCLYVCVSN